MNVSYHVGKDGKARIVSGTPAALAPRENLILVFDVPCDSAVVFFNRRRFDAKNGIARIAPDKLKEKNELLFQYTAKNVTHTVSCETILLRDGELRGADETTASYAKLKQMVISLAATCDYLKNKTAELTAKVAALEATVNGTEAFKI